MTVTRIQYALNRVNGYGLQQLTLALSAAPANGDTLCLCISYLGEYTTGTTTVTQTGVTWSRLLATINSHPGYLANESLEIWVGTVGSGASTGITVNTTFNMGYVIGHCVEYHSNKGPVIVDKYASWTGGNSTYYFCMTGLTSTTSSANQIWLCFISATDPAWTSGITFGNMSSYTLIGGGDSSYRGLCSYDKSVSTQGQAGMDGSSDYISTPVVLPMGAVVALSEPFCTITAVTAVPSSAERAVSSSTLTANFIDSADLVAGAYTVYFYAIGPSHTYGPFAGTVTKDDTRTYHATYSYQPGATDDLGVYSIKARLTKP
jgi:hypothetical protein